MSVLSAGGPAIREREKIQKQQQVPRAQLIKVQQSNGSWCVDTGIDVGKTKRNVQIKERTQDVETSKGCSYPDHHGEGI